MTSKEELQTLLQGELPIELSGTTIDNLKNLQMILDPAGKRLRIDQILLSIKNVTGNISVFVEVDLGEGFVSIEEYEVTITGGKCGNILNGTPLFLNGRSVANIYLQDSVDEDFGWKAEITWGKVDLDAQVPV